MKKYGFIRVAAATPNLKVSDCQYNATEIIGMIKEAESKNISAIVFPELCLTAYTCQDLFFQDTLLNGALEALERIRQATRDMQLIVIVGLPLEVSNQLYNVAAVLYNGVIYGIVPKTYLPNYNEFYEKRWFSSPKELKDSHVFIGKEFVPVSNRIIFETSWFRFGIEICEDLWTPIPPSSIQSLHGADIIFNLSASNETTGKHSYRKSLVSQQSARCIAGYVYAAAGSGESTTDIVFSGSNLIAENGTILSESDRFAFNSQMIVSEIDIERLRNERIKNKSFATSEDDYLNDIEFESIYLPLTDNGREKDHFKLNRYINPTPFVPSEKELDERCSEIFSIQVSGLAKRLLHTNIQQAVIGVSGGLDSTLALLVIAKTFDKLNIPRKNIIGITMPGFGTTNRTYNNAVNLMKSLGITNIEIPIKDAVLQHFKDIDHSPEIHDVTYENSQARERTQILMDYANKVNGLVIGTGDLSELALGWCTYNGDHMSMYAVNTGIPKTLVKTLVLWVAKTQMDDNSANILTDVADTPISPELLPADKDGNIAQKTEDSVGPYILHDFFLYNMLRFGFDPAKIYFLTRYAFKGSYTDEIILKWLKVFYQRFFTQQFKRSCMPDGPKIGSINLSPRGDWRMPSDASSKLWMTQLNNLQ